LPTVPPWIGGKFNAGRGNSAPRAGIPHAVEKGNAYPSGTDSPDETGSFYFAKNRKYSLCLYSLKAIDFEHGLV
jgi:hypothetical protein